MKKPETLDISTVIELSKQAFYRVKDLDPEESNRVGKLIESYRSGLDLTLESVNFLLNFTFKHRHLALQPKTIRSMINEIFMTIGHGEVKDQYSAPNVSKSELELIHNYIMSTHKMKK